MNDYERLKAAKKYLWNGKGIRPKSKKKFLCNAIVLSGIDSDDSYEVRTTQEIRLKQLINERLGDELSYESWIIVHHSHLIIEPMDSEIMCIQFQRGRLDWLNSLIKEFKYNDCFGNKYVV